MAGPTDVIIAGTKPFALALFAPVTERAGSRPRIAPEPAAALALCVQTTGLLVVEYQPKWLPALAQLRQDRPDLRMVAALPPGQESAALSLGPLSIDAVPWNGQALSIMPAIERAIGTGRAAAAVLPAPPGATPMTGSNSSPSLSQSSPSLSRSNPALSQLSLSLSRSNPALSQSSPSLSRSSPALSQSSPARSQSSPTLPAGPPHLAGPASSALAPLSELDLFTDLGPTVATPFPASRAAISTLPVPGRSGAAWPATGPSAAEAELALRSRLAGTADTSPLRAVTEQTVAGLSSLEREVFTSGLVPVDAELIRHAAVLRLRAAAALATRPPSGTPTDSEAVAELLSEIDGVLHRVKALVDVAGSEVKPSLEAIRNALVKEAVDFSEACHEIGTVELPLAPAPVRQTGRAAAARVISSRVGLDQGDRPEEKRRRVVPLIVLGTVLVLAAGYHGWNNYKDPMPQLPATFEGAPAGTRALVTPAGHFVVLLAGKTVDPTELERFRMQEQRKGNVVREVGPGRWIIEPVSTSAGAKP